MVCGNYCKGQLSKKQESTFGMFGKGLRNGLIIGLFGGWIGGYIIGSLVTWWSIKHGWKLPWEKTDNE